jgi:flagellar basal body rod protein FlgC
MSFIRGLTAMAVSMSGRSAEHMWMNIAASMLAHAQTTRGVGRGPVIGARQ